MANRQSSISVYGTSTAPAAGAAIATLPAASLNSRGLFEIRVQCELAGTPGVGDRDNFQLQCGAAVVRQFCIPGAVTTVAPGERLVWANWDGVSAFTVNAVGVGTAGAIYSAVISATKLY